jgi:NDP-sugar pyrophosphorylase family protein
MKALILAAGLGTRLKDLTSDRPKALVEMNARPLLDHAIEKVRKYGFNEIVVNVHHYADMIEAYIRDNYSGMHIMISDERKELLGSGGALKHAQKFFDTKEPFLVYNVDVISDIDLNELLKVYEQNTASAVLAVRKRETQRYLCFDKKNHLCGWKNISSGEVKGQMGELKAFSGIQLVDPQLLDLMPLGNFSIIDFYLKILKDKKIIAYDHSDGMWMDLGTPERLMEAEGKNW